MLFRSEGKRCGIHLIATFHRLRVQPLRRRVQPMWALERGNELDNEEVESKVRSITRLRQADACNITCPVEPYGPNNPVPEVRFFLFCFCLDFSSVESFCLTRILSQGRSSFVSLPPLMENGPHDEATVVEQDDDEDELPSPTRRVRKWRKTMKTMSRCRSGEDERMSTPWTLF